MNIGGISNPFTQERQEELKEKCEEFLTSFGKNYALNFPKALYAKIQSELQTEEKDERRLLYREWGSVPRQTRQRGFVYMKQGKGQGDFSNWKKVYLMERNDYNLVWFKNDQDPKKKGAKPKGVIELAGYRVEENPQRHYQDQWDSLKEALNATDETDQVFYSQWSWALVHSNRTNYIFQLHPGKNSGGCLCFGGGGGGTVEPAEVGSEFSDERNQWMDTMHKAVSKVKPRNTKSVTGRAFTGCVFDMKEEFDTLANYNGNGTEEQMLMDMLVLTCVNPGRDGLLADVEAPSFGMKIKMVYTIVGLIETVLSSMVGVSWPVMQGAIKTIGEKIEPAIRSGVEAVEEGKKKVQNKIEEKFHDKVGNLLSKYIKPFIEKPVNAFEKPLADGFVSVRVTFERNTENVQGDAQQVTVTLDAVPRSSASTQDISKSADTLVEPFENMKQEKPEVFGHIDTRELRAEAENMMLEVLDAAFYTFRVRLLERGIGDLNSVRQEVLEDYDHDSVLARNQFMKDTIHDIFIVGLKKRFMEEAGDTVNELDDMIPEALSEIISVKGILNDFVDYMIGEPINQMVDSIIPPPGGRRVTSESPAPAPAVANHIQEVEADIENVPANNEIDDI